MVMAGNVLTSDQISAKIDAVTEAQVKKVQSLHAQSKPSVAAYGNVAYVPHYDTIVKGFGGK